MEAGDCLDATFTEPMALPATASVTVTETDPNGNANDSISIPSFLTATTSLGSDSYITVNNSSARFSGTLSLAPGTGNKTVRLTLSGACVVPSGANDGCVGRTAGSGNFTFTPTIAGNLRDVANNAATGSVTQAGFIAF